MQAGFERKVQTLSGLDRGEGEEGARKAEEARGGEGSEVRGWEGRRRSEEGRRLGEARRARTSCRHRATGAERASEQRSHQR